VRVLISGIAGFAGSHLAELALRAGAEVAGIVLPGAPTHHLAAVQREVQTFAGDLREAGTAARILAEARPDRVFHLAGASVVGTSWAERTEVLRTNLETTYQLLEGLRSHPAPCLLVSSGEVYGVVPDDEQPIPETRPVAPVSPYGLSKACQEIYGGYYVRAERVPVVIARAFNHVGPRQGPGFVASDVARQVAAIEKGLAPPILEIGTLTTRRDFTDVRDVVRAYWLLLERAGPGEVCNVASGHAVPIQALVESLLALSTRPIEVRQQADRVRPIDLPLLVGDARRLRSLTGWRPTIGFEQSVVDILEDWRRRV
jgi:GDP-4-dehydro-6-deoxy-D-mannose reductase